MSSNAPTEHPQAILVVEDDPAILEVITELLESEGYRVACAVNGQDALDQLAAGLFPNLILLDLMMPVRDGFSFRIAQLENPTWAKIPVVVMSADGNAQEKLDQIGGATYLRKPPELEEILDAVRHHAATTNHLRSQVV